MSGMMELMTRREPLCGELLEHVHEDGPLGLMVHHPLVIEMVVDKEHGALLNRRLALKKQAVDKAAETNDWSRFVFLHERPYRIDALYTALARAHSKSEKMWELVGEVWIDQEYVYDHLDAWVDIWSTDVEHRPACMDARERRELETIPEELTVWRGTGYEDSISGLAWTTDRAKAEWFAYRWQQRPILVEGRVAKRDVFAYFLRRGEHEVVAENVRVVDVKHERG